MTIPIFGLCTALRFVRCTLLKLNLSPEVACQTQTDDVTHHVKKHTHTQTKPLEACNQQLVVIWGIKKVTLM